MLKFIKKAIGYVLEVAGLRVPGATAGQVLVADADGVFTPGAGGGGNALQIQGRDVSNGAPTDGDALRWDAGANKWAPAAVGAGSLPSGALGSTLVHNGTAYVSLALGTAGQVFRVGGGTAAWSTLSAVDVGAITAPGSPNNGGVLAYAGDEWASTAAGTPGQLLRSHGAAGPSWVTVDAAYVGAIPAFAHAIGDLLVGTSASAWAALSPGTARRPLVSQGSGAQPSYTTDVEPLTQRIVDGVSAAVSTGATITHDLTGGSGSNGIGARCLLRARNGSGAIADAAAIDGVLTTAAGGAESSAIELHTRTGGAALRRVARVTAAGGLMLGAAVTQDPGVGGIAIPTTTGLYIESGGTLYNAVGVFGGSAMSFGSGAFNVTIAAFALTISSAGGTVMSGGYLDLAAGFRRRVTTVNNANHTVTSGQSAIEMTNLSAARVVTGPAAANGTIVTITNPDGTADGTKTVTFTPPTGTVNGAASHVGISTAHGSCTYLCNGTNWTVIAKV